MAFWVENAARPVTSLFGVYTGSSISRVFSLPCARCYPFHRRGIFLVSQGHDITIHKTYLTRVALQDLVLKSQAVREESRQAIGGILLTMSGKHSK